MFLCIILAFAVSVSSEQVSEQAGCWFSDKIYKPGQQIVIGKCLGAMTCLGNNNLGNLQQWGGLCPNKRADDGQSGCLFDGRVYQKYQKVVFKGCLGEMTCLGNNLYSSITSLYGVCPTDVHTRSSDGQTGCLFDGRVYAPGEDMEIRHCLGKMQCLGNNNLGPITPLYGICERKRTVDGQTGCLFDGSIYDKGQTIQIQGTSAKMLCLGHNLYKEL